MFKLNAVLYSLSSNHQRPQAFISSMVTSSLSVDDESVSRTPLSTIQMCQRSPALLLAGIFVNGIIRQEVEHSRLFWNVGKLNQFFCGKKHRSSELYRD